MPAIEVFVMIDENGDYACHTDRNSLDHAHFEAFADVSREYDLAKRIICLTINVPLPKPVKVTVNVPADDQRPAKVKVAQP